VVLNLRCNKGFSFNWIEHVPRWRRLILPQQGCESLARDDRIRGKRRGTVAQRTGNPSLAFGPVVAATARGRLAQRQNFG
jgi:hypothetical protein